MNRGDLMDAFGVSVNQASTDLNRYLGMAPDNMAYDKSARTYIRGSNFDPMILKPDASRYLSQLQSVGDRIIDQSDAWIGQFPSYDAAPTPVRGVNAKTLRSVAVGILGPSASLTADSKTSCSPGSWKPAASYRPKSAQRLTLTGTSK